MVFYSLDLIFEFHLSSSELIMLLVHLRLIILIRPNLNLSCEWIMHFVLLYIIFMGFTASAISAPSINVGQLYEFIEPQQTTLLKRIRNSGDQTAYVRIAVSEIIYSGKAKPVEKPLDMAALSHGNGEGLVASPTRMMIPASGVQANRLLYIGSREKERYYRVRFTPVVPTSGKEFGLSESERSKYKEKMSTGINVMAGYGAIVTIRPQKAHYNTSISESSNQFTIVNNGNTTIIIEGLAECKKKITKCSSPIVRHLIPGASLKQSRQPGKHYHFTLIEGRNEKKVQL